MKRGRRQALRFVLACCCLLPASGWTVGAGSLEEGVDAVILEEHMEIEIRSATDARVNFTNRTKLLTADGVEEHSVASVFYRPGVEVRAFQGSVTSPSGKLTKIKKKEIFDGAAFASFQLYSDSRHRSIRFPGVVPGSIVEHSYELAIRNLFFLPSAFYLQDTVPIRAKTVSITAPTSFPIRLTPRGGAPEQSVEEIGGRVTHRWRVGNVPALERDRGTPPTIDLLPRVLIGPKEIVWGDHRIDAETWDGIGRFYWDLARDRMNPSPEVARKAHELTDDIFDPPGKTRRIYEFVQGRVNYVSISLDIGGYQPHPNGDVLKYMYGDCKDKATLVIAMLRAVDLNGFPVLIRTRDAGLVDRDTPGLNFNHAIVAVPAEEGLLFMDPTSEDTRFGDLPWQDQGVSVVVVKGDGRGELMETPLFAAEHNRRHIAFDGRIDADGALEGQVTIEAWGQRQSNFAPLLEARAEDREEALADLMAWLSPGAQLESQEVDAPGSPGDPLRFAGKVTIPRYVTRAGTIEIFSPHVARFPDLTSVAAYSGRRQPLFFRYLFANTVEARLTLPAGRTLKKIPEDRTMEGPGVKSTTKYELLREGGRNVLVVRRSLAVSRREIPIEEYGEMYEFVAALAREEAGAVTLKPEI